MLGANTKSSITRRDFLAMSAKGLGTVVISYGLMGCDSDDNALYGKFNHGIASGDPAQDAVILWTRVTPEIEGEVSLAWEVATDEDFSQLVTNGSTTTNSDRDYTVKIDAVGLEPGTSYYYRFKSGDNTSVIGKTKTLPQGDVDQVKFAVMSCSNFPAGYFNVYEMAARRTDLDAVLHLGDYLYEYGRGEYASDNAEAMNRQVFPEGELLSLSDYRTRYGQYRSDASLQKLHQNVAFINVWDDHEVTNDTWKDGAENHNDGEGDFDVRKQAALQAYFEWLPIRPWSEGNHEEIYRSFKFGELVDLHMLDTRVIARDEQLNYANYIDPTSGAFNSDSFMADVTNVERTLLGQEQLQWLQQSMLESTAKWQVLGQQVLMGKMTLPAAIATQQMEIGEFAELAGLAQLAARAAAGDPTLTVDELAYLQVNQARLTPEVVAMLQLPSIPYNLDAWDGYAYEREVILATAKSQQKNLVVVAGDTHNAWANHLTDASGEKVGVEFATSSVSSPGMEYYLGIADADMPQTEAAIVGLVDDLKYTNLRDRGYMVLTFTAAQVRSDWVYVDTIKSLSTTEQTERAHSLMMKAGDATLVKP
ncbi:alkaline phosphatase [Shewanella maritima]|uniref:Alkaline phosphatase n=1 Tax=Shewanella maritima TaxID=2520507 RepID=A0A411PH18_9GAMM|nr:alkaline phosphatase D family protein [Shewanella maritima]QBF82672.1 alkaline phosphatase [Shewanella maritima]